MYVCSPGLPQQLLACCGTTVETIRRAAANRRIGGVVRWRCGPAPCWLTDLDPLLGPRLVFPGSDSTAAGAGGKTTTNTRTSTHHSLPCSYHSSQFPRWKNDKRQRHLVCRHDATSTLRIIAASSGKVWSVDVQLETAPRKARSLINRPVLDEDHGLRYGRMF